MKRKNGSILILLLLLSLLALPGLSARADAETRNTWQYVDGNWYHYDDAGNAQTGWQKIKEVWYYFDSDGVMQTGWQALGNWRYYFGSDGAMRTGWQKIDGDWFYFSSGGGMMTGWQKIGGKWYYLAAGGEMQTGWQKIGSNWYYFATGGAMQTGWQKIGSSWYYLAAGGAMQTGWQKIGDNWYYFAAGGAMQTGWQKLNNRWYYFTDGGQMLRGFHIIDEKARFFGPGGDWKENWSARNVIVLDPGHSSEPSDEQVPIGPGAEETKDADSPGTASVTTGLYEYELNLTVALKLRDKLQARGYTVLMTRTTNRGQYSCIDRANVANDNNAAVFLRIHANAAPKNPSQNGAMTICITAENDFVPEMYKKSRLLSDLVLENYVNAVGCYNEDVWETDTMTGNNWSKVPTTLIELGYMTNVREDSLMQTTAYQEKMVKGLVNGIDAYFSATAQ